jgi:hypothetical protein
MQYVATYNQSMPVWKVWLQLATAKRLFFVFSSLLVVLLSLYMFFIYHTIHNVVSFNQLQKSNSLMAVEVNSLQSEYSSRKASISLATAYQNGYEDASSPQFIPASSGLSNGAVLSYQSR